MNNDRSIETIAWNFPRPRYPFYKGGFPLHFEGSLLKLYGFNLEDHYTAKGRQLHLFPGDGLILHPFGGMAEYGIRVDISANAKPHVISDAHNLPFKDDTFTMVIVDPPYSDKLSKDIYGTGKLRYYTYVNEAVRVCKPGGHIALYHVLLLPRPRGTAYDKRIMIAHRLWHRPRVCNVFRKLDQSEINERGL